MTEEDREAEKQVIGALKKSGNPRAARLVIDDVESRGVAKDTAREAIWRLLDRKRIYLTREYALTLTLRGPS
jgi:hypothetical protein